MTELVFEARKAYTESTDYLPLDKFSLVCSVQDIGEMTNGTIKEITLQNANGEDFVGVIHIKLLTDASSPEFFMPGYMYGNNTADMPSSGRKKFPRIRTDIVDLPDSDFWMTRSDRLAEPMSLIYADGRVTGLAADPYLTKADGSFLQYNGFSCCIEEEKVKASVGYTLGYENAPYLFVQTADVYERAPLTEKNAFVLKAGDSFKLELRIYDYAAENELGIYDAMKDVYALYYQAPRHVAGMTVNKATELLAGAVRDYAWLPDEKMYTGFVYDKPEGFTYNKIGSLSWTNGMAVICPMLMAANRLQDEKMREQALIALEDLIAHSYNKSSGLLYDAVNDGVWGTRGWWFTGMHSGGHSSYINGQAVYYILKSYLSELSERHIFHDDWLAFVKPVIEKMNAIKNTDDEYPFAMSEKTGAGIEYDSFGSTWCLAATAMYCKVSGDLSYLDGMKKSEKHYYDAFVKKVQCYGGPLDTDKAIDNEGILAYVRAVRILHELTGDGIYLEHLRDGLYYECSYKLGYNTPIQVEPLSRIGWSSCGGSITSVANPHIHPMSNTIVDEMIYLLKYVDDSYIKMRLNDTVAWGMQTFNTYDGEYDYGRIGWMSERFCFCQGLLVEKYPDGSPASTWFALMPWASASIIEGFVGDCWST